jgi:selenide,water dikinase
MQNDPVVKDIVLVGGGHAHALVLRSWGMKPLAGARLTLINPAPAAPYTGMLPGHIAGHYPRDAMMIDLVRLARFAGAQLVLDSAIGIDRAARQLRLTSGRVVDYDLCSLDIGIASDLPQVKGFAQYGFAAKPLGQYAAAWARFLAQDMARPHVVLIGAGVGGVELALASMHRLRGLGKSPQITLVQRDTLALKGLGHMARRLLLQELRLAGITLMTGAQPVEITQNTVILADGRRLPSDFTLAVAGARGQGWLGDTGLDLVDGHISVTPYLRSSDPAIFAAGDCAHMGFAPRPKAGVYAVRTAPILAHNLRASLLGQPLRPYHPQRDYLKLISLGGRQALADKWHLPLHGPWVWRAKDRIDRKFMARFGDYPAMAKPPLPAPAILGLAQAMGQAPSCGGCGAKLGAGELSLALQSLPAPRRDDVLAAHGDDCAILRTGAGAGVQVITTDQLRSFGIDPYVMAQIAATHALGDIWAMGAAPQAALAQITLPPATPQKAGQMLAQIMQAAAKVITDAGADMVGGHSAMGAELSIGFTITGLAQKALRKSNADLCAGDALILTKPLGSGVIMAAEMAMARPVAGHILGEVVAKALALMQRGQGQAAAILAPHARAMTDVTGFGLAGHLLEILSNGPTPFGAVLDPSAIPLMPGAWDLAKVGHASTLLPANLAAHSAKVLGAGILSADILGTQCAWTNLLHDPQTSGGLLAAVPNSLANDLLAQLQQGGDRAAIIGHICAGTPRITLI